MTTDFTGIGMKIDYMIRENQSNFLSTYPPMTDASYIIYQEGSITKAKNGISGNIKFSGSDASSVINNSLSKSNTIFIKNGTYKIKTPLTVYSNTILEGEGLNTILQADIGCTQIIQQNGYVDTDPFGTAANNVTIRNIHFDGNNIADRCIQSKINYCHIENCIFEKALGFSLKMVRCNSVWIQNNIVLSSGADCIHVLYCNQAYISNNYVTGKNDDGIAVVLSDKCVVHGNYVNGENSEAGSCYANWGGSDNIFYGNIGENEPVRHGINIVDYLGLYPSRIQVIGNVFRNNGWSGVYINGTSGSNSIKNVIISNNQIYNNKKEGIYITRSGYGIIKNNILANNCNLADNTYDQILLDFFNVDFSTHWNIEGNIIESSNSNKPRYGIYNSPTISSYCNITNNIINNANTLIQNNDLSNLIKFSRTTSVQGTWVQINDGNQTDYDPIFIEPFGAGGAYIQNSSNINLDEIKIPSLSLNAGTYQITIGSVHYNNYGILEVLHGASSIGTVDLYAAETSWNNVAAFTYVTAGNSADLRFRVNGKNASSAGYYLSISKIGITRTS